VAGWAGIGVVGVGVGVPARPLAALV